MVLLSPKKKKKKALTSHRIFGTTLFLVSAHFSPPTLCSVTWFRNGAQKNRDLPPVMIFLSVNFHPLPWQESPGMRQSIPVSSHW